MRVGAILLFMAGLLVSSPALAQQHVTSATIQPLGFCTLSTALSSATPLSSCSGGIPTGATMVLVTVETQNVRWRDDGTAPTTTSGMVIVHDSALLPWLYNGDLTKIQFIAVTGSPVMDISFYKAGH